MVDIILLLLFSKSLFWEIFLYNKHNMVQFESIQSKYFEKQNKTLSLDLDRKVNIIYHSDSKVTDEVLNFFNNTNEITYGSFIIDEIIVQDLDVKKRNDFFYSNISLVSFNNVISKNDKLKKTIDQQKKVLMESLSEKDIEDFINEFNLQDKEKIKDLNQLELFHFNMLLSLIKKPKYIVVDYTIDFELDLNKITNFFENHQINCSLVILTSEITLSKYRDYFYNLEDEMYYQNNPNLTIYTKQDILLTNRKNIKSNLYLSKNIFRKTIHSNIFNFVIFLLASFGFLLLSFVFNKKHNEWYDYTMNYLSLIASAITLFFATHYNIFFKNKRYLLNLTVNGYSHSLIVLNSIINCILFSFLPLIGSIIIFMILFYATDLVEFVNISKLYLPIILYLFLSILISFLSSMKLRININDNK